MREHRRDRAYDAPLPIHAGLLAAYALLLVVSGFMKILQPKYTVGALNAARLPSSISLVYVLGTSEIAIGLFVVMEGGPISAAALTALYLGFAGFVVYALRNRLPIASCGCFGKSDTPPSSIHLVLNSTAVVAGIAGVLVPLGPWAGLVGEEIGVLLPFISFVVATVYLLYATMAVLPARFPSRSGTPIRLSLGSGRHS